MRQTLYITLFSTFFKLDLLFSSFLNLFNNLNSPPFNHKKKRKKVYEYILSYRY